MSSNQGEASLTGEAQQPEMKETGGDGQLKGSKRAKVQRQKEKPWLRKEEAAKAAKDEESILLDEAMATRAENERMQREDRAFLSYEEAQQALAAMDKCRELQVAMEKGRKQAEILEKEVMELRGRAEQQKGAEEKAEEGGEDHRQVVVEKEEEESSSQSSSSGDDTGSSSEEEPERGRGDTFPG